LLLAARLHLLHLTLPKDERACSRAAYKKKSATGLRVNYPWAECSLQTYFIRKGQINYFVLLPERERRGVPMPRTEKKKARF